MRALASRWRILALGLVVLVVAAGPAAAVTVYDSSAEPSVRLASLQPMPEAVRAILAFYAMRASSGCASPAGDGPLQCGLTKALGFASQCAPAQLELVGAWFRDGAPPINLSADHAKPAQAVKPADLALVCTQVPDTATHRMQWESIRLDRVGDQIQVHALLAWTSGPDGPSGRVSMVTRYLLLEDRVTVLKHTEKAER